MVVNFYHLGKLVADLIKSLKIDTNMPSVVQLGKQSNRPRPIRITFDTNHRVTAMLKSKNSVSTIFQL